MGAYSPVALATPRLAGPGQARGAVPYAGTDAAAGDPIFRRALRRADDRSGGRRRRWWSSTAAWAIPKPRWCYRSSPAASPTLSCGWREGKAPSRTADRRTGGGHDRPRSARLSRCPRDAEPHIVLPKSLPEGVTVFHAGTSRGSDGVLRVSGGRVLTVTAVAASFPEAQRLSREAAEAVRFEGKIFRRDIGWREAARRASGARTTAERHPGGPMPRILRQLRAPCSPLRRRRHLVTRAPGPRTASASSPSRDEGTMPSPQSAHVPSTGWSAGTMTIRCRGRSVRRPTARSTRSADDIVFLGNITPGRTFEPPSPQPAPTLSLQHPPDDEGTITVTP